MPGDIPQGVVFLKKAVVVGPEWSGRDQGDHGLSGKWTGCSRAVSKNLFTYIVNLLNYAFQSAYLL